MAKKKTAANALRTHALNTTLAAGKISKFISGYAKHLGLSTKQATAKLLSVGINRLAALGKYNDKPAAKKGKAGKKAKTARKAKAAAKPRKVTAKSVKKAGGKKAPRKPKAAPAKATMTNGVAAHAAN